MSQKIRLNKYIASCGLGSRRTADDLIKAGFVKVNGKVVNTPGISVTENDVVTVKGKVINPEKKEYLVFHKPPGYITSTKDEKDRKTIYDVIPEKYRGLKTAGRLDKASTGLLILTNDGELIQKLTHPKKMVPKVYRITAEGRVTEQDLIKLKKGIEIEKSKIAYADAIILDYSNFQTTMELVLYQGYNKQIRRMLDKISHPVISLKRVSHACISLGGLDRGKFRYMNKKEVQNLYNYLKNIRGKDV